MAYPNYAGVNQASPASADYQGETPIDSSRINQISGRLKYCQEIAGNLAVNMSVELDRVLGSVPQPVSADHAKAVGHGGALNQLDELVSGLIETIERLASQTQRLSSI